MPMSESFQERLFPALRKVKKTFKLPAHIYDERGMVEFCMRLLKAFWLLPYNNFFAVKACPNPAILKILFKLGFGFDCSSIAELRSVRKLGATPDRIMFTSNNTSQEEFREALAHGGCILNLDDIRLVKKVPGKFPEFICFRYNPGKGRTGNAIIGEPYKAKYGVTDKQLVQAYRMARKRGAKRFGIHTMVCSNELHVTYLIETVRMLLKKCALLKRELGIECEFINIGGGAGIPYRPGQKGINFEYLAQRSNSLLHEFAEEHGFMPRLMSEFGRCITGPYGVIVAEIINRKEIYRKYLGINSGMSDLMRHGMYGSYHHIDILTPRGNPRCGSRERISVSGSICENIDRFATERLLPKSAREGDIVVTQDTGAHGIAMGFNYNGRLRSQELLLRMDGSIVRIGRAQVVDDLFRTYKCKRKVLKLN